MHISWPDSLFMKLLSWKMAIFFFVLVKKLATKLHLWDSISVKLLKQDVLSHDYVKKSIQIKSFRHWWVVRYNIPCFRTEERWCYWHQVSYVQGCWNSSKAVKLKHIDYWVWTVSDLLRVICGSYLSFESSGCFHFLQELTLSSDLTKSQSILSWKNRLQPLSQSETFMILGLNLLFEVYPKMTRTPHLYEFI